MKKLLMVEDIDADSNGPDDNISTDENSQVNLNGKLLIYPQYICHQQISDEGFLWEHCIVLYNFYYFPQYG
jgi:hypothetical protein